MEWKTLAISDGSSMDAYVARPRQAKGRTPGIIVIQEIFGVNSHIQDVTNRVAELGYVAIAPDMFHRTARHFEGDYGDYSKSMPHTQALTPKHIEADLKATFDWLAKDDNVNTDAIGCMGFCMGGRVTFLANAILPLRAAVSYYGGGIAPNLLSHAKDQHGPILLYWGGRDKHIGVEQPRAVADALREAHKDYTDVFFAAADHGFFRDVGTAYNPKAAKQSWALTTQFFADNLGRAQ